MLAEPKDLSGALRREPASTATACEPLLVGAKRAAELLGISERLLWSLTKSGEVPCVRIRRRTLYSLAALRTWCDAHTEGGRATPDPAPPTCNIGDVRP